MAEHVRPLARTVESANAGCVSNKQHGLPEINADQLFGASNTVAIMHAGEVYLLTRTKLNKLLLTKQGGVTALPAAVRPVYKE